MEVGLIGLGNMGRNLAMNIDDKKYKLHVYNRTSQKTEDLVKERPSITKHYTIKSLCDGFTQENRIIIVMVTAGQLIDDILDELEKHLNKSDIVIDIGNSYFKDTIRRSSRQKFNFVGAGISGGELGARYGGSIMVGCDEDVWTKVKQLLYDLSTNDKCCKWFGSDGAGHFVKMVHNGIEYCDMNVIAEAYLIFRHMQLSNDRISKIFEGWNEGRLRSYLVEICSEIMAKQEDGQYVVDLIEDSAQQKGTGKECCIEAVGLSVPAITIVTSTFSRLMTGRKDVKNKLNGKMNFVQNEKLSSKMDSHKEQIICKMEETVYLCRAISYVQGLNLLSTAGDKYKWKGDLTDVSDVWSDGCILRGEFLRVVGEMTKGTTSDFEASDVFVKLYNESIHSLKDVVLFACEYGIPIPAISSCYNYVNELRDDLTHGNLIQGMRDCFGGHTVVMKKDGATKHIDWLND